LNGVAEAFVASVAADADVHRQSAWMTGFSIVFATAGYVFLRVMDMGAVGLVFANIVNMLCRIMWCTCLIIKYFRTRGIDFELLDILPSPVAIVSAVVVSRFVSRVANVPAGEVLGMQQILTQLLKIGVVALPYLASQ
jgi:oligosaccharide translocation protein RFT1